jgi:hypothetical protein
MRNVVARRGAALGTRERMRSRPVAAVATLIGLSLCVAVPAAADAFSLAVKPPAAASAAGLPARATVTTALSGLYAGRPSLRLKISSDGSYTLTAVSVTLPPGLAFGKTAVDLARGVAVNGHNKTNGSVRNGRLRVPLPGTSTSVGLTISGRALTESKGLLKTFRKLIAFNAAHTSKRALPLSLVITVGGGTHISIKVPVTITFG